MCTDHHAVNWTQDFAHKFLYEKVNERSEAICY